MKLSLSDGLRPYWLSVSWSTLCWLTDCTEEWMNEGIDDELGGMMDEGMKYIVWHKSFHSRFFVVHQGTKFREAICFVHRVKKFFLNPQQQTLKFLAVLRRLYGRFAEMLRKVCVPPEHFLHQWIEFYVFMRLYFDRRRRRRRKTTSSSDHCWVELHIFFLLKMQLFDFCRATWNNNSPSVSDFTTAMYTKEICKC